MMLFQEYSKYKGNSIYPARLLELLHEQQKIVLFEIPFDNTIKSEYFNPIIYDETNTTNKHHPLRMVFLFTLIYERASLNGIIN